MTTNRIREAKGVFREYLLRFSHFCLLPFHCSVCYSEQHEAAKIEYVAQNQNFNEKFFQYSALIEWPVMMNNNDQLKGCFQGSETSMADCSRFNDGS